MFGQGAGDPFRVEIPHSFDSNRMARNEQISVQCVSEKERKGGGGGEEPFSKCRFRPSSHIGDTQLWIGRCAVAYTGKTRRVIRDTFSIESTIRTIQLYTVS